MKILYYTFWRDLLAHKQVKKLLIGGLIGALAQTLARQYIKSHPEYFEKIDGHYEVRKTKPEPNPKINNKNSRFPNFLSTRGGDLIEVSPGFLTAVKFIAETGLMSTLTAAAIGSLSDISTTAIAEILSNSLPQNLPELKAKKLILVNEENLSLQLQCDQNLEYLFEFLKKDSQSVSFKEKKRLTYSIFTRYLNLETMDKQRIFVLCIVGILSVFSITDMGSYHLILKNLLKAIKKGKISKTVGRAIIRRLKKKGLVVHPALLEVIDA